MSDTRVTMQKEGDITVVTLDDGKANVFATPMTQQLQTCFDSIDKETGAVIVTGRPKFFSAGFDLKTIQSGDAEAANLMRQTTVNMAMDIMSSRAVLPNKAKIRCCARGIEILS